MGVKIATDGREFQAGQMTGIGRYLDNFLRYAGARHPEHEFIVFGDAATEYDPPCANVRVERLRALSRLTFDQRALPRGLARVEADVFFSPYIKAPLRCPCPYVTTIHDLLQYVAPTYRGLRHRVYQFLLRIQGRMTSGRAVAIVSVSEHSKADITRIFGVGSDKIHVAHNVASPACVPGPDPNAAKAMREWLGFPDDYILYVGNFSPHKNVESALRAYAGLDVSLKERCRLVLTGGKGPRQEAIRGLSAELGVEGRVLLPGYAPEEHLAALYREAAVFIFPSFYEGFGLPVLEAMACGTPVVCSNASSLPEVTGDAALLVDPTDVPAMARALRDMLFDSELSGRLRESGLARAKEFQPERSAEIILQVLTQATEGPAVE